MPRPLPLFEITSIRRLATLLFLALLAAASARTAEAERMRTGPPCVAVASLFGARNSSEPASSSQDSKADPGDDPAAQTTPPVSQPSAHADQLGHEVCVAAHVYQVVELRDGTRFLDVCPAAIPDDDCRFILLSRPADREEVGDLRRLGGAEVQVRGRLRPINGRFGIYISHARQLDGGPEKFRPNPRLLKEFDPESDHLAVRDPNLRASGRRRTFMNRTLKAGTTP